MTENNTQYEPIFEGLGTKEKHTANKLFNEYRENYHIDNFSDLQVLSTLVFREILQIRYKLKIASLSKNRTIKDSPIIPKYLLDALDNNEERILVLKDRLGLFKENNVDDPYKQHEILEKKFDIYREEHPEEFKTTCPFCSEIFFMNIRTEKYQESKLKLYKNKVLCNEHLWKCYKEGKITKEDMSTILNVSSDYIDWLEEKIYNLPGL